MRKSKQKNLYKKCGKFEIRDILDKDFLPYSDIGQRSILLSVEKLDTKEEFLYERKKEKSRKQCQTLLQHIVAVAIFLYYFFL